MLFRLGTRADRERDEPIMSQLSRGSVVAKQNLECQSGLGERVGGIFWPLKLCLSVAREKCGIGTEARENAADRTWLGIIRLGS